MKWSFILTFCGAFASVTCIPASRPNHRQTLPEAASWTRDILDSRSDGIATLVSVFPDSYADLGGRPLGMMEYFAPGPQNGSLYLLLMPISQNVRNILTNPDKNATLTIKDEEGERQSRKGQGAVDRARFTLFGQVTLLPLESEEAKEARKQYVKYHPDAESYAPPGGNGHFAHWAIFNPTQIYFIGGFGDAHYIGWMPLELYQSRGAKLDAAVQETEFQAQQQPLWRQSALLRDW